MGSPSYSRNNPNKSAVEGVSEATARASDRAERGSRQRTPAELSAVPKQAVKKTGGRKFQMPLVKTDGAPLLVVTEPKTLARVALMYVASVVVACNGQTNSIARTLGISTHAVRDYVRRINEGEIETGRVRLVRNGRQAPAPGFRDAGNPLVKRSSGKDTDDE